MFNRYFLLDLVERVIRSFAQGVIVILAGRVAFADLFLRLGDPDIRTTIGLALANGAGMALAALLTGLAAYKVGDPTDASFVDRDPTSKDELY